MQKVINLFDFKQKVDYKTEVLSGLTVALALVPEAVAFALIAGLSPLTGLYAAFMMGLVTSVFGGRPGMISGATGAVAVVLVALVKSHGVEYIFATVVLAGIFQMLTGFLKLGKLIRLVPHPVIFGFVNGLAIIIFMSQLEQFKRFVRKLAYREHAVYASWTGIFNDVDHMGFTKNNEGNSGIFGFHSCGFWNCIFCRY